MTIAAQTAALVAALVWIPLSLAGLSFVLGRMANPWLPLLGLLATAGAALALLPAAMRGGLSAYHIGGWSPPLGIAWRVDGLAAVLLAITAIVSAGVGIFAAATMERMQRQSEWFWPLLLLLLAGLNALFLTRDLFNAYVALEIISLAAVALVTIEGTSAPIVAGMRYLLAALAGSLSYLLGVALLYASFGTLDFALLAAAMRPDAVVVLALALTTAGLFIKAAFFPLHVWLPPAHGAAPAPVSAMLSALVVKAGFYLLLRLWFEVFASFDSLALARTLVGLCGAGAVLWGSMLALCQQRLKPLLAYSTVAQLGYLLLLFPLAEAAAAWQGTLILVSAHAAAKAAMFLAAGIILRAYGHDRITAIGGAARGVPLTIFAFGLAGLSLIGLPPSGGFAAKWLLLMAAFESGRWWWSLVPLVGGLLAAGYVFIVLERAFGMPGASIGDFTRVPRVAELAALGLALASFMLGFAGNVVAAGLESTPTELTGL